MKWTTLNSLQLGRYAEYLTKMEFTKIPDLSVFTIEVDDRGIDFILRHELKGRIKYFEIQVKSFRVENTTYVFIPFADDDIVPDNYYVALVQFEDNMEPKLFLIPIKAWGNDTKLLKVWTKEHISRKGIPRKREYGIRLSKKNLPLLEAFRSDHILTNMMNID